MTSIPTEQAHDWVEPNRIKRFVKILKLVAYLTVPGIRERLGFGTATSVLPAPPPPDFESGAVPPGLQTGNMTQGNWLDTVFMTAFNNYNTAYEDWKDESKRTKVKTQVMIDAEAVFIPLYRKLYAIVKVSPLVTNADLIEMEFPVRQHVRTPSPVPTSYPVGSVTHPAPDTVVISFRDSESGKVRKPAGVHGAEIAWAILDEEPQHDEWEKLTHSSFDTASPFTLSFSASEGKELYFALRWENTRGEKGPWSFIQKTVIS